MTKKSKPFEFSKAQLVELAEYASSGVSLESLSHIFRVPTKRIMELCDQDTEVAYAIYGSQAKTNARMAAALVRCGEEGDVRAIQFFLKNRDNWSDKSREEIDKDRSSMHPPKLVIALSQDERLLKREPEIWVLIPDLPLLLQDDFEISNYGRVRCLSKNKILKGGTAGNTEGWVRYELTRKVRITTGVFKAIAHKAVYPHRLVADLFVGKLPYGMVRYHVNGCKEDNYFGNLAFENKRWHKRRTKRLRKQGRYYHKRGSRYFHQRFK